MLRVWRHADDRQGAGKAWRNRSAPIPPVPTFWYSALPGW